MTLLPAGFLSERQWGAIDTACGEDFALPGNPTYTAACQALLTQASATAGKFYVYDVYLLRQRFLVILPPFRLTDFFDGAGTTRVARIR